MAKSERTEQRFFIAMTEQERDIARDNMKDLKSTYRVAMSKVLREVILNHMNDREFLEYIGILEKPTVKVC